jgi:hypothetical protein
LIVSWNLTKAKNAANEKLEQALANLQTLKSLQVQRERLATLGEMASGLPMFSIIPGRPY